MTVVMPKYNIVLTSMKTVHPGIPGVFAAYKSFYLSLKSGQLISGPKMFNPIPYV